MNNAEPYLIGNSGGRSSAMMTEELLRDQTYHNNCIVCFTNTGKEDEATLIFLHRCGERWRDLYGVELIWLEYCRDEGGRPAFRIVTFETASRKGEPFAAMLEGNKHLPNLMQRRCTRELKIRTIKRYLKSLGIRYVVNLVGIRKDEPERHAKVGAIAQAEGWDVETPLIRWGITSPQVRAYWRAMPFDLEIESPVFGNCDLCFLKGKANKLRALRLRPEAAEFWIGWEDRRGATFSSRYSIRQLRDLAVTTPELFDETQEEPDIPCICSVD